MRFPGGQVIEVLDVVSLAPCLEMTESEAMRSDGQIRILSGLVLRIQFNSFVRCDRGHSLGSPEPPEGTGPDAVTTSTVDA